MIRLIVLILATCFTLLHAAASTTVTIRGIVRDASTQQPLGFATLRVDGTTYGSYSSRDGSFLLRAVVKTDSVAIRASMVGYESTVLRIPARDTILDILLAERPLRSQDIVVRAEDPAQQGQGGLPAGAGGGLRGRARWG